MNNTLFEQFGGKYTWQGDYILPNLILRQKKKTVTSKCGDNAG